MLFKQTKYPDGTIKLSGYSQGVYQYQPYYYNIEIIANEKNRHIITKSELYINRNLAYSKTTSHTIQGKGQTVINLKDSVNKYHQLSFETTPSITERGMELLLTGSVNNANIGDITLSIDSVALRTMPLENYQKIVEQIQSQLNKERRVLSQIYINPTMREIAHIISSDIRQSERNIQTDRAISGCALACTAVAEGAALACGTVAPPAIVACAAASLALQGACLSHCATKD